MDEEIDRARLRAQVWRDNRQLFNRNEGLGELRQLSEEELGERDEAVALQMEGLAPSLNYATRIAAYRAELMRREVVLQRQRMEELTANVVAQIERMEELTAQLVRQREQMETLNDNLKWLMRIHSIRGRRERTSDRHIPNLWRVGSSGVVRGVRP